MTDAEGKRLLLELVGETRAPVELPRQGVLTVGSDVARADFALEGPGVDGVHCAIGRSKGGGYALKDLGSRSGTLVNGKGVQSARLEIGDVIAIGAHKLRVVDPEATVISRARSSAVPSAPRDAETAPRVADLPTAARALDHAGLEELPSIRGYRVERVLGKGGMGEVYLAVQEALERQVALKVLSRSLSSDADFVRRFLAEARAAAALTHPNVVVVYDAGADQGHHYLSMEYMDRGNLESRVARQGALPASEVLGVMVDAAKGLQYAEAKGIVHRDIKPANLMQNHQGLTKIADLGLASHLDAEATQAEGRKIFGTPHFVAPEQARGERVDHRADLYSLGATAYRLLTGKTPFEGATTRDILRGHFNDEPRKIAELAPSTPPALALAVHRLLAKKPEDRFQSAEQLLVELERLRAGAAAPARQAATEPSRHPHPGMVLAALVVAAAAGFALWRRDLWMPPEDEGFAQTTGDATAVVATVPIDDDVDPTAAPSGDGETEDLQLKLLEAKAELAYRDIPTAPDRTDPATRRDLLIKLAGEYAGTTIAARALSEAERLASEIDGDRRAEDARTASNAALLSGARETVDGLSRIDDAAAALAKLVATFGDPSFDGEAVVAERNALLARAVARSRELAAAALAEVDAAQARGDFEAVERDLEKLAAALTLPSLPADVDPAAIAGWDDLARQASETRARLGGLDDARASYETARRAADLRALFSGLGGPSGLERELASLDVEGALARLRKLEGELEITDLRTFATELASELESGRRALESVGRELERGNWRRKTVADPRRNRASNRNAVGGDARGLVLEVDGGTENVAWSDFGARPRELHQLFHERLTRDYTADELAGIATLMRVTAVASALADASEMLQTARASIFTDGEQRAMLEGFPLARQWARSEHAQRALDREELAAQAFGRALTLASNQQWTSAVAELERVERDFADTLLFRLLSGGPQGQ